MITKEKQKAFTLIELLVVIAIIGLLASIIMVSMNNARISARNTLRKADLKELASALELYANDNGVYPLAPGWWGVSSGYGGCGTTSSGACGGWIPNLAPTYISVLPTDPNPTAGEGLGYLYGTDATGKNYMIRDTSVEGCISPPGLTGDPFARPGHPTYCEYTVYSPGAWAQSQ